LDLQPAAISDLVSDTLESFAALAEQRGVVLAGGAEPGVDPVLIDARLIGRVLANLVGNALRHTPAGGTVAVRAWPVDGQVQVEVNDTGEGIAAEDVGRVFERFYRSEKSRSRATGGSGLGLAIAKGIIEAHGGRIGVEGQPGQGARFYFTVMRP
jgi:signal transduction histidine kinase